MGRQVDLARSLVLIPFLLIIIVVWAGAAYFEEWSMKRKGYEWDFEWGGYWNRKTGNRIRGWT
jgi:hypothetical protein